MKRQAHGTTQRYTKLRCRCPECSAAAMDYNRRRRRLTAYGQWNRWTDATGTLRRLNALAAAGWSATEIGNHLGQSPKVTNKLRIKAMQQGRVHVDTAQRITYLYEQLWHQTPTGRYQERVIRHAQRMGWAEPWQWEGLDMDDPNASPCSSTAGAIDEIAVERAMRGYPTKLTKQERAEAVMRLADAGYSIRQIAERLRIAERTVLRRKAAAA